MVFTNAKDYIVNSIEKSGWFFLVFFLLNRILFVVVNFWSKKEKKIFLNRFQRLLNNKMYSPKENRFLSKEGNFFCSVTKFEIVPVQFLSFFV